MKTKQAKRSGASPSGMGRNERGDRRSGSQGYAPLRTESEWDHLGLWGPYRQPRLVGVSDTVRVANNDLARRASREMKAWKRSLPKGVKI